MMGGWRLELLGMVLLLRLAVSIYGFLSAIYLPLGFFYKGLDRKT